MPIRLYLGDRVFRPEQTEAMGEAFERVCKELGLKPDVGPDTGIVASLIIGAATAGEKDPQKLCAAALNVLRKNNPEGGH